ncbi:uncharacterized protein LOC122084059 isoform X2 [Macadamia integrifolia]|uniref:uncharacterized protein LOC122084059 isoform X2 n=1 Tax=Macadamia integrifolia TaxID=60698 RepID=UPI001C4F2CE8|nr:uncharacterized protein LOC122084059 isoform X2 [Macadamia integrifolia]
MKSDTPLDYAVFQLSPKRSRCELFISGDGATEKLTSGLLKPFVAHLAVAEEQVARAVQSIKLEVEKHKNAGTWFTKGTLERFVRFVSTPEVLELVNTFDAEMSQLEGARRIYSQGGDKLPSSLSGDGIEALDAADNTKKELLRAIDVRLVAVKQDLTTALTRASAAGFTLDTVSELQLFADRFGAHRLNKACSKFISLCQRRPELICVWKNMDDDQAVRTSFSSDMSIDDLAEESTPAGPSWLHQSQSQYHNQQHQRQQQQTHQDHDATQPSEHSKSSMGQQPKSSFTFPIRRSDERGDTREGTIEKDKDKGKEENVTELSQTSQPSRRLSVQDRINMFENKQKEQSGSGGKVASGKSAELRRMSSDVSSAPPVVDKAVLRRWSGASDMSMDLSNDRKEAESSFTTPSSSTNSQAQSSKSSKFSSLNEDSKDDVGLDNTFLTSKAEFKGSSGQLDDSGFKDFPVTQTKATNFEAQATSLFVSSEDVCSRDQLASQNQVNAQTGKLEKVGWKDQAPFESQSRSYSGRGDVDLKDRAGSQTQFRSYPGGDEQPGLRDQTSPQNVFRTPVGAELPGVKDQVASQSQFSVLSGQDASKAPYGASVSKTGSVERRDHPASQALLKGSPGAVVDIGSDSRQSPVSHIQGEAFSGKLEGGADQAAFQVQYKGSEGDWSAPPSQWSSFPGKMEDVGRKELASLGTNHGDLPPRVENNLQGMKLQRQSSASEQSKKSQGRRGESTRVNGNSEIPFPGRKITESLEVFGSATVTPIEQVQKIRQSKGGQELNDELQLKANELEKLFAAHKLRVTGDLPSSVRRAKGPDAPVEQVASEMYRTSDEVTPTQLCEKIPVGESRGSSSNIVEFDFSPIIKMVDNQDYGSTLRQNITKFGSSEDSRGKFYDRYMQKREEKLREEWSSKRVQKEAKMKAMQDSLERSRAEMKTKFMGTPSQQDSTLHARRRAEKLRSFNIRLASKNREQPIEYALSENDEDPLEFAGDTQHGRDISFNGITLADGSSRNTQPKKHLPSRSSFSSTPRTVAVPAPRSSAKGSNSGSGRQRSLPENSLAQSVPNFSEFRKENTKPSTGISKTATRSQFRNPTRSKSTNEDLPLVKEEKPRRSQSMRKSFATPGELKELTPQNTDGVVLAPVRFSNEKTDEDLYGKSPKNAESKPSFRKGDGTGLGVGAGLAKMKASMASEDLKDEEDFDEVVDQPEEPVDMVKGEEEEEEEEEEDEFGRVTGEESLKAGDFPADSDNDKSRLSQESEKSGDLGSENGNVLRSLSQVDHNLVVDMVASGPISFHSSAGNVHDSPGESPASWNSRMHHPFSYVNETSDIDAGVDSPVGSPASWNLHSLSQMESDAARMRKKWGSAQKPVLVSNTSHHLSRKDMTKGFKRLLKFGRKSRGSESLVDWISATTSEGDDDTEDGRDLVNRSSEDVRKSRMGSSQGHPSYDGFNDGELFDEQVQALHSSIPTPPANFKLREDHLSGSSLKAPRSFFSLSSFRSKGTESKPR